MMGCLVAKPLAMCGIAWAIVFVNAQKQATEEAADYVVTANAAADSDPEVLHSRLMIEGRQSFLWWPGPATERAESRQA